MFLSSHYVLPALYDFRTWFVLMIQCSKGIEYLVIIVILDVSISIRMIPLPSLRDRTHELKFAPVGTQYAKCLRSETKFYVGNRFFAFVPVA
jgi:hypothetical protein